VELLKLSLACLRRSLKEDLSHEMTLGVVEVIRTRTPLSPGAFDTIPAFEGDPHELLHSSGYSAEALIAAFRRIEGWDERMQVVMWLGGQGIPDFVPLLVEAVDRDTHPDVRMAAIKRLGCWPDEPGVRECFERLVNSGITEDLGPYPGIALGAMERDWARELEAKVDANAPWRNEL
jgi:hypothetical protein